jgi:hypothetical protein
MDRAKAIIEVKSADVTSRNRRSFMKHLTATAIGALMVFATCTARADVVTDWNVTANALVANDVGNNPRLRTLAMVHVAMSDAINTVQNRYTRVVATLPVAPGASAEAAAATAARQILTQVYPEQKAKIEEAYGASLKAIPDGPPGPKASSWVWRWPRRSRPTAPTTAPTSPTPTGRTRPLGST